MTINHLLRWQVLAYFIIVQNTNEAENQPLYLQVMIMIINIQKLVP